MENKFYNELRKFKKAEKVELGLMQDVLADYKKGLDLFTSAKSTMDRASEILDNAERLYKKLEDNAKELGVDIPSSTAKMGDRLKSISKEARKFKK